MTEPAPVSIADLLPDMPSSVEVVRAMADHYYELGNQLERVANHMVQLDSDPEYAQRIREAEDQVTGDELLMDMQRVEDPTLVCVGCQQNHRTVKHE